MELKDALCYHGTYAAAAVTHSTEISIEETSEARLVPEAAVDRIQDKFGS
ncbi:hypothetical protein [Streptomyces hirsutus]